MSRRHRQRLWLRNHGAVEKGLVETVEQYFQAQADALADALIEHGSAGESTVDQIFRPVDWNAKLQQAVTPHMLRAAAIGAEMELAQSGAVSEKSADALFDFDFIGDAGDVEVDIPPAILRTIRGELQAALDQPYWLGIQQTTRDRLVGTIANAIDEGLSLDGVAERVRQRLGRSPERSLSLARTELTGAMNCGHDAARRELINEALVTGSEWISTEDGLTRPAHAALDGAVVTSGELFEVGGERAPYPGYYGLSAKQRVHCRCTTVAAGTFAD